MILYETIIILILISFGLITKNSILGIIGSLGIILIGIQYKGGIMIILFILSMLLSLYFLLVENN